MPRSRTNAAVLALLLFPSLMLAVVGAVFVSSATARQAAQTFGDARHFTIRQLVALGLAAAVGAAIARTGLQRLLRAAPFLFVVALLGTVAVFVPGIGVRAAGASRWLQIGPLSGRPAPLLTLAVGLLVAAWAAGPGDSETTGLPRRTLAVTMAFVAILILLIEPDFSAAGTALLVSVVALAALRVGGRWLLPATAALILALVLAASQFGYVGGRVSGFMTPERDRRGKGFEVLALTRARAATTFQGVGLGNGAARRHLSSPASDYAYAVIGEEMGRITTLGLLGGWLCIGAASVIAARGAEDRRLAAASLSAGMAMLVPAALHVAVCAGWVPIIGVSMPIVSYDPAATVAAGAQIGVIASVALSQNRPGVG